MWLDPQWGKLDFLLSTLRKRKKKVSLFLCYKIHKDLISPFRYNKTNLPEGQVNLSASPLVSVMQATTYKSVPLCPIDLRGVSSVLARISTSTYPSFLSLGDKNSLLLCSGSPIQPHAAGYLCAFQVLLQAPYSAPSQPAVAQLTVLPSGCHV